VNKEVAIVSLWDQVTDIRCLWAGWQRVRTNGGAAGGDGVGQHVFARTASARVERLAEALRTGRYVPGPYRHVAIPKKNGGERVLAIPCIGDRIVQTAAAQALNPVLDPRFSPASFAYRPGRGVAKAVQAVLRHRREGYRWTAEGDIDNCFGEIPHEPLLERLERMCGDARLTDLVGLWLSAYAPAGIGIPQGAPISPLLANLHLDAVDAAAAKSGVRLVRYADDFVLLAKGAGRAEAALENVSALLRMHGLRLDPDKSRIVAADQALRFLGHVFIGSMAWREVEEEEEAELAPPDAPPEALLARWAVAAAEEAEEAVSLAETRPSRLRTLHIVEPGALLTARNEGFLVLGPAHVDASGQMARPSRLVEHARRLDRIEIGPGAEADWGALQLAASRDLPVAMVDGYGETAGWLGAPADLRGRRVAAQASWLAVPGNKDALARAIVRGRVRNQWLLLRRLNRSRRDPALARAAVAIRRVAKQLPEKAATASLRGHEGDAGRLFWPAYSIVIPDAFAFAGARDRRPPPDPVNACLGFLYALLERDMRVAVGRAGLHPAIGALHEPSDEAAPLVYDLMEAFRASVSEAVLPVLIGRRALRPDMFVIREELGPDGRPERRCRIERDGRRALIQGHESWLARPIRSRRTGRSILWRALFEEEARALADLFLGESDRFVPYELDY
jgi:CRISP-associated protein Cas1